MSVMLTLSPRGVNFVLDAVERRLFQPPIKPRHLAQRNIQTGMTVSRKSWLALAFACLSAGPAPAAAAECRDETDAFQGVLRLVRTRHAMNSTPIEAWQIVLKPPVCVLYKELGQCQGQAAPRQGRDHAPAGHAVRGGAPEGALRREHQRQTGARVHIGDAIRASGLSVGGAFDLP